MADPRASSSAHEGRAQDGSPREADDGDSGHVRALTLQLEVVEPEVLSDLLRVPAGPEREAYALRALRIGLLALRQASGALDADVIRAAGDRMLARMQMQLNGHQTWVHERLEQVLREYFDPSSGKFADRVQRLVSKDGELERVLREQMRGGDSPLQQTLAEHMGPESALMKRLSPSDSEGLIKSMEVVLADSLTTQRDRILEQFSLDNEQGALTRLVRELGANHKNISEELKTRVADVVGEFSLDKEGSALNKLVRRVDEAQRKISAEFSLDQETSALARMKREMLTVFERAAKDDAAFREAVLAGLAEIKGRREEADRSTRHGLEFESELIAQLVQRAQAVGDIATATGNEVGKILNSKVGDAVWELGPDHAAAGVRIVIEAKESKGVSLAAARAEIEVARKNRAADVGLFVFSRKTAPDDLRTFQRLGSDVFLVWDASDPGSDVWLDAAIEVARALGTRADGARAARAADFDRIDRAILALEKVGEQLDEITTASNTIESANERIRERVRKSRKQIVTQVGRLQDAIGDLKDE
ncbi:MAG: hypothetical protein O2894_11555 [Planctomycetota bacterium]|nr:hypothetical protein [Planctomycetota bacterium]